ncbi:MAG: AAA-like domain-containing protein [Woeseiaceae bacterium]|nr:AAA-like domain-containing protein [Woeseiaceae bacterium]
MQNIREPVMIFVDGIQVVEGLPFKEHLLPSIRAAHNARATEPDFERLGFALAGECDPHSLVVDESLSPFRVSEPILLENFTRTDLDLFATELNLPTVEARVALDRVWHWTSGQPYLTQKLCRAVSRDRHGRDIESRVDALVLQQLAGRSALQNEPHLMHIHRRIVRDRADHEVMLNLYGRLRKGMDVLYEPDSRQQRKLLAVGLVLVRDDGRLAVGDRPARGRCPRPAGPTATCRCTGAPRPR